VTARVNRRVLVMADQGVSSLSNVVVAVFVARSVSAEDFGAFGLATVAYLILIGISRALVGEPFLSRFSHVEAEQRRQLLPELIGAALAVSGICAVAVAALALALSGAAAGAMTAFALVVPVLVVQDVLRYACIVDRPGSALANDVAWLVAVVVALVNAPAGAGASWFVAAWGLTAGVGVVVGLIIERSALAFPHPVRWLVDTRAVGGRFLGEFFAGQAVSQVAMGGVGAISGLGALGAVRASQVYYGPANTVHLGVYLVVVPDGAKMRDDPTRMKRLFLRTSLLLVAVAAAAMAVGVALPDSIGRMLLDESWPGASELMIPMGLAMMAGGAMSGGFDGVRALGDAEASLRARLLGVPGQLVFPLVGAYMGGAVGFVFGLALGRLVAAGFWWGTFLGLLRHDGPVGVEEPPRLVDEAPLAVSGTSDDR
jgi:O-antigen/teichoic acid export membrane protein